jgi:hypothetical protein
VKIQTARGTSLAVSVHLGTSLRYVDQVPKCPKVVHLGLDHVKNKIVAHPTNNSNAHFGPTQQPTNNLAAPV